MTPDLTAPVDAADHSRGMTGGRQLVVYGDFECPYTAAAMRDIGLLLFRNQPRLEPADLRRYAERLGLDLERFESDLADTAVRARVERDVETGLQSAVDGTPSLFIDGRRYRGPRDTDSLGRALGPAPD